LPRRARDERDRAASRRGDGGMKPLFLALALLIAGCSSSRPAPVVPVEAAPPVIAAPVPEPSPEPPEEAAPPPVEVTPPTPPPAPAPPAPEEPVARPAPRPTPPPPVVRPAPPAPVPAPSPTPQSPPPVVAARVPHEDQVAQEVSARLTRTQDVVGKIDPSKLNRDQREIYSGILDFIAKAKEAYQAKDMPRAQVLAEKASKLADDL